MAERQIAEAVRDARVVMVTGPRQAGRTTLVQRIAERAHSPPAWFTLDDAAVAAGARADPTTRDLDLNGLRKLRAACGDAFAAGVVLYDHDRAVPFGHRLHALPLSALWA